jgi:hypothetical protein
VRALSGLAEGSVHRVASNPTRQGKHNGDPWHR